MDSSAHPGLETTFQKIQDTENICIFIIPIDKEELAIIKKKK